MDSGGVVCDSMGNKLSLPLFAKALRQTNLNHLPLSVDPVLIGWLCNAEAVGIYIMYGLIPTGSIPRGMGLPKNLRK